MSSGCACRSAVIAAKIGVSRLACRVPVPTHPETLILQKYFWITMKQSSLLQASDYYRCKLDTLVLLGIHSREKQVSIKNRLGVELASSFFKNLFATEHTTATHLLL